MQQRYPFKFLDAYTREDQDIFFGREEEIATLYEMVFQTDLILIYGASGTGKTSLIKCGLASKFHSHDWLDLYIRRGNDLNQSFEKVLQDAGGHLEEDTDDLDWLDTDWAAEDDTDTATLAQSPLARSLKAIYLKHFKPIYLIFDQFEELYILGNREEQEIFVDTVKELLRVEQPVKLIISIREEYLGYLYEFEKAVPELLRKKLRVEPMNLDKVRTVVQKIGTAPNTNVRLQAGEETTIAEQIFEKIKGEAKKLSIPLPYLQVFFDKLYLQITGDEDREELATFSLASLQRMKDIDNVLRDFLDEQVVRMAREFVQEPDQIWSFLSPFVTLEGTKEPLSLADLQSRFQDTSASLIQNILQAFQKSRILRFNESEQLYEVAHDSLALQIHAKRSNEEIAILEVQRLIRSQMALKAEARAYLPEDQLELVELYSDKLILSEEEEVYLVACKAELARQKREKLRRRRLLIFFFSLAFVILGGLTIWALDSQQQMLKAQQKSARDQKIKTATELEIYGDNYRDLGKPNDAIEVYQAALDSLGEQYQDESIYQQLKDKIKDLQ